MFNMIESYGHERVVACCDRETGLKAIIAVHDTTLGPALGGTRMWNYNKEEDAIYDVLRLSKGMTYKNAAAGLNMGGGKAVLIGDPKNLKSPEYFKAYGRMVDSLKGTYITAEDVNTSVEDMECIKTVTPYVSGLGNLSGNPSPYTALGVYRGICAAVKFKFGLDSLKGLRFAVQGVGNVGYNVCRHLHEEGAELLVFDINKDNMKRAEAEFGAKPILSDIVTADCDVFVPCALGAVISEQNVPSLKCKLVSGAANNVLVDDAAGDAMKAKDILYVPDFIINAGGVINVAAEVESNGKKPDEKAVIEKVNAIYDTVTSVLKKAQEKDIDPHVAAEEFAMERIMAHKAQKAAVH